MGLILKEKKEEKKLLLRDLKRRDIAVFVGDCSPFIVTDDGFYVYLNTGRCHQIAGSDRPITLLPPGTTFIIEE